ncbi:hypothetical protein FB45DRAFT_989223 [Roridomyces roridus]|uniref:SHSP domain-containing protein n=1 Tax=Roridomyces roridus TaxID=1738132 RepID=A0AAD7C2G8_9AGAR|nr:hypothetical protein FB45DRAFT_989223 [Roridomyces roridus]
MSLSPPIRRLSSSSLSRQEELINAYEAEEERIMNVLSKKLEQLREEKIELENVLEAESESHVNRLTRELSSLRLAQQQLAGLSGSPGPSDPSTEIMLATLQRENEALRARLAETEKDYVRMSRLNEIYREELIEHRNRLGQPVDNLIGLASADPYSQATHQRPQSAYSSTTSSPTHSVLHFPTSRPTNGVPIPRPPTQTRRISTNNISEGNTPLSHSPSSSSDSPFPFSPITSPTNPSSSSYISINSNLTSPPTSFNPGTITFGAPSRGLTYPSVPPPSLSSSFGSPTVSYHMPHREPPLSPVESHSRRNSMRRSGARVAESGSLRSIPGSGSVSRRASVERGGRVAETGQLVPRSHLDATTEGQQYPVDEYSNPTTPRDLSFPQPQWEQQPLQQDSQVSESDPHQPIEPDHPPLYPPPLDEPTHIVPTQTMPRGTHDPNPVRLHPPGRSPPAGPVPIEPILATLRTTAHAGPSTRPSSRTRALQYHPYDRPHARLPSQTHTPQALSPAASTGMGRQTFTSPLSEYSVPLPAGASPSFIASPTSAIPEGAFSLPAPIPPPPREQRYLIRADTQYDPNTRLFTALLEVPGIKSADMHIALGTTIFNRCRQVTVSGHSRPVFPPTNPSTGILRERKYGHFTRKFPVPPDTKPEDIDAAMEDGVLVLKISCGLPAASADEHEIPIR